MPAVRHCSRIDTFELKHQLEMILGTPKSEKYFNLLARYLSLKIRKSEFDKLCIRLIGRENIHLHNELIRSVLKNATVSKIPPPKQVKHDNPLTFKYPNGCLQTLNLCERKFNDKPSPLGLDDENHMEVEVNSKEDALSSFSYRRIPITAPFGINVHSNETCKVSLNHSCSGYYSETCHHSGQLLSKSSLENRLKQKLKMEDLDISTDCVDILNNGLDSYLKRVIKPCMELASSRFLQAPRKRFSASLLDFQMGTVTNPKMLGEDWSIQLEKLCLSGFDNK